MNRILKNMYVLVTTVVLLLCAAFVATKEPDVSPHFRIQNEFGQQRISIYDARDGNHYVFLPSYADLEDVQAVFSLGQNICLDDFRLKNQMTCRNFELEKPYAFSVDGQEMGTLWFYKSKNVATMYIDTVSGKMTDIHNDKNYEEYATMTLYLPDGSVDYYDVSSKLKGRGNATWECDKRPYVLTLSGEGDLLGMGNANKWVLLANAYDETNLNNKLIYDMASQVNFEWSPDSQFVDLYLNGKYNGLYLLTEKVEVHKNRLNLDKDAGDFLCKIDLASRMWAMQNPFETSCGRVVDICYPEVLSYLDLDNIQYLVYLMECEFRSGADLADSEILDLDSWVRRYLIDEISGNIDSDLASSYFYYSDGKMSAGPVWDYDMAFGNNLRNQEPNSFLAKNENKTAHLSSPYYSALYGNEAFYNRMVELYRTEFSPVLQEMIGHGIDEQIETISAASCMNSIRWRKMYAEWKNKTAGIVQSTEELKDYFVHRIQFLDSTWLSGREYCTVQFAPIPESQNYVPYWNISVEKGTCLETTYMNLVDTVWVDKKTGQPVDFQSPITEDMVVATKIEETKPAEDVFVEE